jgi:hypothetical protein
MPANQDLGQEFEITEIYSSAESNPDPDNY